MLVFVGVLRNYELTNCCNDIVRVGGEVEKKGSRILWEE